MHDYQYRKWQDGRVTRLKFLRVTVATLRTRVCRPSQPKPCTERWSLASLLVSVGVSSHTIAPRGTSARGPRPRLRVGQRGFLRPAAGIGDSSARSGACARIRQVLGPVSEQRNGQIPSLPLTWHLTEDPDKRNMIFQVSFHRCYFSGREGTSFHGPLKATGGRLSMDKSRITQG